MPHCVDFEVEADRRQLAITDWSHPHSHRVLLFEEGHVLEDEIQIHDRISIDPTDTYQVSALKKLTRSMTYSRTNGGKLSIEDHVIFSKPSAFEIALSTRWEIKQTGPNTLEFTESGTRVLAQVTTPAGFELSMTDVEEPGAPSFTRIGLKVRDRDVWTSARAAEAVIPGDRSQTRRHPDHRPGTRG